MKTRPIARRGACAAALVGLAACAAGCGLEHTIFGTPSRYLLTARDVLVLPDEQVTLWAGLESGSFLRDTPGIPIRFRCEGRLNCVAVTDDEGHATAPFRPPAPGDYLVTVSVEPTALKESPPQPVTLLVACRQADEPLAVVDLDKTLVASGFKSVLWGDPRPMSRSMEVTRRLAKDRTIVYLTHRADFLGPKSKAWLHDFGYPRGPLLAANISEVFEKSGSYKAAVLQGLRQRFCGPAIGIGDQVSDALAYERSGLEPILLLNIPPNADAHEFRKLADSLQALPESAQVVTNWTEIERVLFGGQSRLSPAVQAELRRRADELDKHKKAG